MAPLLLHRLLLLLAASFSALLVPSDSRTWIPSASASPSMDGGGAALFESPDRHFLLPLAWQQCNSHFSGDLPLSTRSTIHGLTSPSFLGTWQQTEGNSPFTRFLQVNESAPMVEAGSSTSTSSNGKKEKLVSLRITADVDMAAVDTSFTDGAVNVSVFLQIGVLSKATALSFMDGGALEEGLHVSSDMSAVLGIFMEGVYAEIEGERTVLCLLGSSTKLTNVSVAERRQQLSDEDGLIKAILYLHEGGYGTTHISGTMESLKERRASSSFVFFDPVQISVEQLGLYSKYQNYTGATARSACSNDHETKNEAAGEIHPSNSSLELNLKWPSTMSITDAGDELCSLFGFHRKRPIISLQLPNRDNPFSSTIASAIPGMNKSEFKATHLPDLKMQEFHCSHDDGAPAASFLIIRAVIKAVMPSQEEEQQQGSWSKHHDQRTAANRLDGLTLAAEGIWDNGAGELCMLGCRVGGDGDGEVPVNIQLCDTRIRMSMPRPLSIKQRSIVKGSIVSIHSPPSFHPFSFHYPYAVDLRVHGQNSLNMYEYSRFTEATALMEKHEAAAAISTSLVERMKKSLLQKYGAGYRYPSADLEDGNILHLSQFDLPFSSQSVMQNPYGATMVNLGVITMGTERPQSYAANAIYRHMHGNQICDPVAPCRVAVQLGVELTTGHDPHHRLFGIHNIAAEGWYNPSTGDMFLIGCRHLSPEEAADHQLRELLDDDGQDCQLEIRLSYPPKNAGIFASSSSSFARLTIASNRASHDPLYFAGMELKTGPILYRQLEEISQSSSQRVLYTDIFAVSLSIGCVISQLVYMRTHTESTPYVSVLMLLLLGVGFCVHILVVMIDGFSWWMSDGKYSYLRWRRNNGVGQQLSTEMGFILQGMAGVALTWRMAEKVYKARVELVRQTQSEPMIRGSSRSGGVVEWEDNGSLMVVIIAVGFGCMVLNGDWMWVHDMFLLPQVVLNYGSSCRSSKKPLRGIFYMGMTLVRLFPRFYHNTQPSLYIFRRSISQPTSSAVISLLAIGLAIVVLLQQSDHRMASIVRRCCGRIKDQTLVFYQWLQAYVLCYPWTCPLASC